MPEIAEKFICCPESTRGTEPAESWQCAAYSSGGGGQEVRHLLHDNLSITVHLLQNNGCVKYNGNSILEGTTANLMPHNTS